MAVSSSFRYRASLVLNAVLALTAGALAVSGSKPAPAASSTVTQPAPRRYSESAAPSDQRRWLAEQLRAMGVPEDLLARIVVEALEKEWSWRSAEILRKSPGDGDALIAVQLEKDMALPAQMTAALGADRFRQWDQANVLRRAMIPRGAVTGGEADAIYDLKKKREQRDWELRLAQQKGEIDQADLEEASAKADAELLEQMRPLR